jgi:hypothetical protein
MVSFTSAIPLLFVLCKLVAGWNVENSGIELRDLPRSNSPRLTAITVRPKLQKREDAFKPNYHCEHSYADRAFLPDEPRKFVLIYSIDASVLEGGRTRIAKTSMEYKIPALILEDIETSLEYIQCSDSTVKVKFAETQMFNAARDSWDSISEFLIISSHSGCNQDGERSPYLCVFPWDFIDPPLTLKGHLGWPMIMKH